MCDRLLAECPDMTHLVDHALPLDAALALEERRHHVDADMAAVAVRVADLHLVCLQRLLDLALSSSRLR